MRLPESKGQFAQRSINLAISSRGIAALHAVDPKLAERFLETVIPMRGRMIHTVEGKPESQLYDSNGQVCPASMSSETGDLEQWISSASTPSIEPYLTKTFSMNLRRYLFPLNSATSSSTPILMQSD